MVRFTRRLALYVGSLLALVAFYTAAYRWGMATYEGESRSWFAALEVVIQSMTTTGYGQDAPWTSPEMTAMMVLFQLTGIAYIFVAFPAFVVPWIRHIVQPAAPEETTPVQEHVVIVGYTELCASLVSSLESRSIPYVVIEEDEDRARDLFDDGVAVVHGDPAAHETLTGASIEDAFAIVVDATLEDHIGPILAIDDHNPEASILALVRDVERSRYLRYAGVDEVLSPRHHLGKAIADRIRGSLEVGLPEGTIAVAEVPVDPDSDLVGEDLEACLSLEDTGATAIGAWTGGEFVTDWSGDVEVDGTTTVLVAGTPGQLEAVGGLLGGSPRRYRPGAGPVLVIGDGITAATVTGGLRRAGIETWTLGRETGDDPIEGRSIDTVGDPTRETVLSEAGVSRASTVVIALEDDDETIRTALVAHSLDPDVRLLTTLGHEQNVARLRSAGVDAAVALSTVAGRLLLRTIFDEPYARMDERVRLVAIEVTDTFDVDRTDLRETTGAAFVGVLEDDTVRTTDERAGLAAGDALVVAGTDAELAAVRERFGGIDRGS